MHNISVKNTEFYGGWSSSKFSSFKTNTWFLEKIVLCLNFCLEFYISLINIMKLLNCKTQIYINHTSNLNEVKRKDIWHFLSNSLLHIVKWLLMNLEANSHLPFKVTAAWHLKNAEGDAEIVELKCVVLSVGRCKELIILSW